MKHRKILNGNYLKSQLGSARLGSARLGSNYVNKIIKIIGGGGGGCNHPGCHSGCTTTQVGGRTKSIKDFKIQSFTGLYVVWAYIVFLNIFLIGWWWLPDDGRVHGTSHILIKYTKHENFSESRLSHSIH